MLTPRHQALVATLAGMTFGVAVFGTVMLINRDSTPEATAGVVNTQPTPKPTSGDGLQPGSLQYTSQTFGSEQEPISADVPTGWKSNQLGSRPRFLDPTGVWQVRFDARGSRQTPDEQVAARAGSIEEQDLKVISDDNGTLIYTYVDQVRGPRTP
jgi:hypothetical protein